MLRSLQQLAPKLGALSCAGPLGMLQCAAASSAPAVGGSAESTLAPAELRKMAEELPKGDPWASLTAEYLGMKDEAAKVASAQKARKLPETIVTKGGQIDADYYTKQESMPPEFASALQSLLKEDLAKVPPQNGPTELSASLKKYEASLKPMIESELKTLEARKAAVDAELKKIQDLEDSLDDLTVDQVLEQFPDIAQEIKAEIEAGDFEIRDYGHKAGKQIEQFYMSWCNFTH
eukprot:TRINITY_DN4895_c1_g2_i1.p1 TRINITY_DN4895_c1_g2~~TRINITY_DN4895_c1_g2_i1.p1  ORF type:complete len:269 (+),score=42.92 TRINITY_DN4895_c1_g2_i1:107-808(+)